MTNIRHVTSEILGSLDVYLAISEIFTNFA